jgi:prepilin-type N-terminal cleavage/methylation domain-containing protein
MLTFRNSKPGDARRGVSLLEVVIATAIGSVLAGAGFSVLSSGRDAFSVGAVESTTRAQATATLDALAERLSDCGTTTASIAAPDYNGGPYFTVQRCIGVTGNVVKWGPPITFCYEKPPVIVQQQDPNAKVGKGRIVMMTGAEKTTIGNNVAEDGFAVTLKGSVATVSLTLERPVPKHDPVKVTVTRNIQMAN